MPNVKWALFSVLLSLMCICIYLDNLKLVKCVTSGYFLVFVTMNPFVNEK